MSVAWRGAKTRNHQGLIIDEATGANIGVIYDKEHVPFIVKACNAHQDLLGALYEAGNFLGCFGPKQGQRQGPMADRIRDALTKAMQL